MDPRRFEELSRRVATAASRRIAVKTLAGALVASVVVGLRGETVDAGIPILHCKLPGKDCDNDKKCCSGRCVNGTCSCKRRGQQCWQPAEGTLCCSQRCKKGRCA